MIVTKCSTQLQQTLMRLRAAEYNYYYHQMNFAILFLHDRLTVMELQKASFVYLYSNKYNKINQGYAL